MLFRSLIPFFMALCVATTLAAAPSAPPPLLVWQGPTASFTTLDLNRWLDRYLDNTQDPLARTNSPAPYPQEYLKEALALLIKHECAYREALAYGVTISDEEVQQAAGLAARDHLERLLYQQEHPEEETKRVKQELILQAWIGFKISQKVDSLVTPSMVWNEYKKLYKCSDALENTTLRWSYRCFTFKGSSEETQAAVRKFQQESRNSPSLESANQSLHGSNEKTDLLIKQLQEEFPSVKLRYFDMPLQDETHLDPQLVRLFYPLKVGQYTEPEEYSSGSEKGLRVFFILSQDNLHKPSFNDCYLAIENRIKSQLTENYLNNYLEGVLKRFVHTHRHYSQTFP